MTDELRPAIRSYEAVDPSAAEGDALNLAWTRDERECLTVDLDAILADELRAEIDRGPAASTESEPRYLDRYLVRDPYGEEALGPAIATAYQLREYRGRITCGAGVVSLLHGLARMASRDRVRFVGDVYPDVPYWVSQSTTTSGDRVWFLERPSLAGDAFANLAELAALCDDAARDGAIVVVDESNASYYPPSWSAIPLAIARENLVVVHGFSKAYGLGGLRLGFCAAAKALSERLRAVVPPLLASSLSLRLGARVLELGDVTASLRARIAAHHGEAIELFERAGIAPFAPSAHLPYVLSRAGDEQLARLEARGVRGKHHPFWAAERGTIDRIYRLSVPLNEARMERLRRLLR